VVYDVPGLRDSVIDGVTGLVVRPNPAALADATCELLTDRRRLSELREAARGRSSDYSWDRTAQSFLDALRSSDVGLRG
jgi:glycosyltransferase involved in cell wall biosynthesis